MPLDYTFKLMYNKGSVDWNNSQLGIGSNVINICNRSLSVNESSLLGKGLKFIPAPTKVDHNMLSESVQKLGRRLKLAYFFQNSRNFHRRKVFRKKSNWTPPEKLIHPKILEKISEMETEIKNLRIKKETPNLKKAELNALPKIKNDTGIVIKSADKGSATVIMNKADYVFEAKRQLSNKHHYRKLDSPIYLKTAKKIDAILKKLVKNYAITKEEYDYLKPSNN